MKITLTMDMEGSWCSSTEMRSDDSYLEIKMEWCFIAVAKYNEREELEHRWTVENDRKPLIYKDSSSQFMHSVAFIKILMVDAWRRYVAIFMVH